LHADITHRAKISIFAGRINALGEVTGARLRITDRKQALIGHVAAVHRVTLRARSRLADLRAVAKVTVRTGRPVVFGDVAKPRVWVALVHKART